MLQLLGKFRHSALNATIPKLQIIEIALGGTRLSCLCNVEYEPMYLPATFDELPPFGWPMPTIERPMLWLWTKMRLVTSASGCLMEGNAALFFDTEHFPYRNRKHNDCLLLSVAANVDHREGSGAD